ncbi:MAG: 5-oxoprolinase subunit B family protein, partial [Gemmataceae bacterium]
LEPIGDQGVMARLDDESLAVRWADAVRRAAPPWLLDVVQAYTAVAVYHDLDATDVGRVLAWLAEVTPSEGAAPGTLHTIPVCYELGPDLEMIAAHTRLSVEDVIRLHTSVEYTVYAIGFCPGFPYLGYLPPELCGVPRRPSPRLRVEPGTVGLTGRQTGIYTEPRPGGWALIGRTPVTLVDVGRGYFPLRTGDRVRFTRVSAWS